MKKSTKRRVIYGTLAALALAPMVGSIVPAAINAFNPQQDKSRKTVYVTPIGYTLVGDMAVKEENGKTIKIPAIPVEFELVDGEYVQIPNSDGYIYDFETNTFVQYVKQHTIDLPKTLVKQQ